MNIFKLTLEKLEFVRKGQDNEHFEQCHN